MNYANARPLAVPSRARASDALWVTYRWMTLGLALTGFVALGVASSPALLNALLGNRMVFYAMMFAQLGLVVGLSAAATRVSTVVAATMFFGYAALTGVTFSTLFLVYTAQSIGTVFFITAGAFAGLSAFGAVTKRDLGAVGRFLIFAVVGIILASIVNIFVGSSMLQLGISVVGVLVFAGLTAYDTQRLRTIFESGQAHANLPILGALILYLDFVNMFLFLLRLVGNRRGRSDY